MNADVPAEVLAIAERIAGDYKRLHLSAQVHSDIVRAILEYRATRETAKAEGRRQWLEEAALLAERVKNYDDALQKSSGCHTVGERIAAAIRAIAQKAEG